jgi:hypothetical protein
LIYTSSFLRIYTKGIKSVKTYFSNIKDKNSSSYIPKQESKNNENQNFLSEKKTANPTSNSKQPLEKEFEVEGIFVEHFGLHYEHGKANRIQDKGR